MLQLHTYTSIIDEHTLQIYMFLKCCKVNRIAAHQQSLFFSFPNYKNHDMIKKILNFLMKL